jgi:hypothetical protein
MIRNAQTYGRRGQAGGDASARPGRMEARQQLSSRQIVRMAWQSIRLRRGRAMLVTAGIVLALAFLSYVMGADAIERNVLFHASTAQLEAFKARGALVVSDADAQIQTRWIVGLAMLVSFVGVLNAMLLSVAERFREIGTMKCLGALDGLVVRLFLVESLFEGAVGTAAGVLLGLGLAATEAMGRFGVQVWSLVPAGALAGVVGVGVTVGMALTLGGALYPAWRAARMAPVAALKLEV